MSDLTLLWLRFGWVQARKTTLLGVTIVVMAKTTANIGCWSFSVSKSDILLTHPSSLTSSQFNWIYWHGSIQYNIANYANYVTTTGGLCHFKVNMLIKRLMLSSSSFFWLLVSFPVACLPQPMFLFKAGFWLYLQYFCLLTFYVWLGNHRVINSCCDLV